MSNDAPPQTTLCTCGGGSTYATGDPAVRRCDLCGGIARSRGYYLNGLKAWRSSLYKQLRQEMARYNRMEGTFHPDRPDMGRYCDLTREVIGRLNKEIVEVESSNG